jgi:hypothetical protein
MTSATSHPTPTSEPTPTFTADHMRDFLVERRLRTITLDAVIALARKTITTSYRNASDDQIIRLYTRLAETTQP